MYRPLRSWFKRQRKTGQAGYVLVWVPEHPKSFQGWYYEHRLVYEKKLGRILETWEEVHHISMIKDDNSPDNLFLCLRKEHNRAHRK
jgi:HNH endonuclease